MTLLDTPTPVRPGTRIARRLIGAQGLHVLASSVDLTLTGIVGAHLAPTRALATVPFGLIPVVAASSTFVLSRGIGRYGYRRVFALASSSVVLAGLVSATAVHLHLFWLFCVGTAIVGVQQAGAGYYRYAAAESNPDARAKAVSTVLAGGLVAALVGPFLATWAGDVTTTPYVGSYLLVALCGAVATVWNARLPRELVTLAAPSRAVDASDARSRTELWRQPALLAGVAATCLAAVAMMSMMTAGPLAGMDMGRDEGQATLAVQLHMIGMFAPGFVVARWIGRIGERRVAALGALVLVVAGAAAAVSPDTWAFLVAMTAVGVGWNLAFSGGSAMIAGSYRPSERGRVQPVAELVTTTAQVLGTIGAGVLATATGWPVLGVAVVVASVMVVAALRPHHR